MNKFVCVICVCFVIGYVCVRVQGASLATRENEIEINKLEIKSDNEVFKIPRMLNFGDRITVTGLMKTDRETLTVNLVEETAGGIPDYSHIVCQVKMEFPSATSDKDAITINSVDEKVEPSELFLDEQFTITFTMKENAIELDLKELPTKNNCETRRLQDIKYLTAGGDLQRIQALNFQLG